MRVLLAALLILIGSFTTARAEPPPIRSFTDTAQFSFLKISPGGHYLALTRRTADGEIISVLSYPSMQPSGEMRVSDEIEIASLIWANNRRLLLAPARRLPGIAYKVPTGEIIGLDANGNNVDLLFGFAAGQRRSFTRVGKREAVNAAGDVVARLPQTPDYVLIQTSGYDIEGDFNAAYRMQVKSGQLLKLAGSPIRNGRFVVDTKQRPTLVWGQDRVGNHTVFHRPQDENDWQPRIKTPQTEGTLVPVGPLNSEGEFIALENRQAPTWGAVAWNPVSGTQRLLYRHAEADVDAAGFDSMAKPWVFKYVNHVYGYWYPDPAHPLAKMHAWLATLFPAANIDITSQTDDLSIAIARVSSPREADVFYIVDVREQKILKRLAAYANLKPDMLAQMVPFEFTARDGLKVRGYLTTPNGPRKTKLPTIVLVHGGPHGIYDTYGFDMEAQLFASRGYAVLQINYRGSGGRGNTFEGVGRWRWGGEMQDDITDGVRWAIGDGVADPKRICIYGASYGAYAALTGVVREPEMFRCAVGMAGVYDLPLLFDEGDLQSVEWGVNYLKQAVGTDMEDLKRRSPVYNAEKIRAPVLLLHGKIDRRAPFEHAQRMRAALTKAGNEPEWYTEWGEGHGFYDEANRAAAYERILAFFANHLN